MVSFKNSEKCSMFNRSGGNVRVVSNDIGKIGWIKFVLGSLDFIMWVMWNYGRYLSRGFEIIFFGVGKRECRG